MNFPAKYITAILFRFDGNGYEFRLSLTLHWPYGKLQPARSRGVAAKHAAMSRPRSRVRIPSGPPGYTITVSRPASWKERVHRLKQRTSQMHLRTDLVAGEL